MGSPATPRDRYFSTYDWSGLHIRWEITQRFDRETSTLLDVGAGWGKTADLLPGYTIDAVEIWRPYIDAEDLHARYRKVIEADIADVALEPGSYDAAILGDVFEHLTVRKAQLVLSRLELACTELYIAVPFTYEQEMVNHNPFEIHQQTDLTPDVMADRYPTLRPLALDAGKGLYVKADAQ